MAKTEKTAKTEETIEMKNETPSPEELMKKIAELEATLAQKDEELAKKSSGGRKAEVLAYLQKNGHVRVSDIAKAIGISDRNVSSQLTYLRKDGWRIATDSRGFKFLEQHDPTDPESHGDPDAAQRDDE